MVKFGHVSLNYTLTLVDGITLGDKNVNVICVMLMI